MPRADTASGDGTAAIPMVDLGKNVLRQALDLSPVATAIVDRRHANPVFCYANSSFEALSGYDAGELLGQPWEALLEEPDAVGDGEVRLRCHARLGGSELLNLELTPLYGGPGEPRYWLATERQAEHADAAADPERRALMSVLREARGCLQRADNRDPVTGVMNRRIFDELLHRDWLLARRQQRSVAVLVFRIDSFAAYGDVFGRHAQDACLRKVAHAITGSLRRASDLTARYGSDSFAVLIGEASLEQAAALAERIAARVREQAIHHPRAATDRFVTVSYGAASRTPGSRTDKPDLVTEAEAQLGSSPALARLQAG